MTGDPNKPLQIWRYRVPGDPKGGDTGGIVVICSDGYFSTVSDYGNYSFFWGSAGPCFRTFLLRCTESPDYFINKLHHGDKVLDTEAAVKAAKTYILRARRDRDIKSYEAREAIDELEFVDSLSAMEHWHNNWYTKLPYDSYEITHGLFPMRYPSDVVQFVTKIMPRLAEMIKKELAAEQA